VITGAQLDHVAIAVEQWADAWPRFVTELGGRWMQGGRGPGFAPSQYEYANGMRVELLEPNDIHVDDFLRRFIDRNGVGPHHLTFKVPDLRAALADVEAAGYRPVGVNFSDPEWFEAFIHPKDGPGVVVQLAQASTDWVSRPPRTFPEANAAAASLAHVAHAVAALADGRRLFVDVLGGDEIARGEDEDGRWVELGWKGPGRLRLLEPASPASPVDDWLAGRPGRVHHLAFTAPAVVEPRELPPDAATGTRIRLLPPRERE
jgi:catechol 2,3-dioxygenase-like lactoylglutathione lyase family enzyme